MAYPTGVRPHYGKIEIRWQWRGKVYTETLDLTPTHGHLAQAARVRKQRIEATRYGLAKSTKSETQLFSEVAQAYLDQAELQLSTRSSYRDALNIYWSGLGTRDIGNITVAELIELDEATSWPSRKTRANALIPLRRVFRYAISRGWLLTNPASALQSRRDSYDPAPDPYSIAEREALLAELRCNGVHPSWEYFTIAFHTGMRTGELIALRWEDFDGSSLYVERSHVRRQTKGTKTGKARRVLLTDEAVSALKSMPRPIHGGAIFTNQYGRPFASGFHLNRSFRAAHKATNVRHRDGPYPWRHTYASVCLTAGLSSGFVAKQLGHGLNVLLRTYAKWIDDESDRAELAKLKVSKGRSDTAGVHDD